MKSLCIVPANGLGDGFMALVLAKNLHRLGHQVTMFSSPLIPLSGWISCAKLLPFPENVDEALVGYDHVMVAEHSRAIGRGELLTIHNRKRTVAANFEAYLQAKWGPTEPLSVADLSIPSVLKHRSHRERVIIHPTSGVESKNWQATRFLKLAQRLKSDGWDPYFMMSPLEAAEWDWLERYGIPLIALPDLADAASFLYESGFFIGNDSGLGHTASLFGVPTLSLFAREKHARVWRPGWGPGLPAALKSNYSTPNGMRDFGSIY